MVDLDLSWWWILVLPFATMAKWISLELAYVLDLGIPIATKARWLIESFFSVERPRGGSKAFFQVVHMKIQL